MSATKTDLLKTIRAKCLDCTCDQIKEVQLCPVERCPLWKYRMGKDPDKRQMSDAQKQARTAALQKAWEKKKKHGHDEISTDENPCLRCRNQRKHHAHEWFSARNVHQKATDKARQLVKPHPLPFFIPGSGMKRISCFGAEPDTTAPLAGVIFHARRTLRSSHIAGLQFVRPTQQWAESEDTL